MSNIKLILGDCLEEMKKIPDKSIDLVLTDPPYNIGKADWDKIDGYIVWCGKWFLECQRVLKDNGSFYFFHNNMPQVAQLMEWLRNNTKFIFKQFIVWNKKFTGCSNEGFLQGYNEVEILRNYQKMAEYCLFYTFQDETGLNGILPMCFEKYLNYMTEQKQLSGLSIKQINGITGYKSIASHWFWQSVKQQPQPRFIQDYDYIKIQKTGFWQREYEDLRKEYEDLRYTFNNQKTHHSVWNYEIAEKQGHITPKPLDLIGNIIKHSSNEGQTILDPFMGSGTTGVACKELGRNFIGIEIEEKYFKIAERRINQATENLL